MIGIVDYGRGNLENVRRAFRFVGADAQIISEPSHLRDIDALVLPGVGAFEDCMNSLQASGMDRAIQGWIAADRPYLGICLGLQVLFEEGHEFGVHSGLGLIPGKVVRFSGTPFEGSGRRLKVPHMGWNSLRLAGESALFQGVDSGSHVYFVHSFHAIPARSENVLASTQYGIDFCSAAGFGNCFATQFHPEKSQDVGLKIIRNFVAIASRRN